MRAITCTGYGRPTEVLRLDDVDEPAIEDGEVLVNVHAAALNPADWHLVRGVPYAARLVVGLRRPSFTIAGSDFAGVVEAVGRTVATVRPGDEVYGTTSMAGFGAFAEKVVVPERLVCRTPRGSSFEDAAAVPLAAMTALQGLRDHGRIEHGQHVLILGASGGVGSYAVQLAKHLGAAVTAVCSTPNIDFVRSLGADRVIDYTTLEVSDAGERYDLVLQVAGTHAPSTLRRLLTATGTVVQISGDSPNHWFGPLGRVLSGRLQSLLLRVRSAGQTVTSFTVKPNHDDLELLATLMATGVLRTYLGRTCALGDVGEALEELEVGHTRGKVVVTVTPALGSSADESRDSSRRANGR